MHIAWTKGPSHTRPNHHDYPSETRVAQGEKRPRRPRRATRGENCQMLVRGETGCIFFNVDDENLGPTAEYATEGGRLGTAGTPSLAREWLNNQDLRPRP